MGLLKVSPTFPRKGWGVIQGGQAALQSLEKTQLMLLLDDEKQEGGEQLYTTNSSSFLYREARE